MLCAMPPSLNGYLSHAYNTQEMFCLPKILNNLGYQLLGIDRVKDAIEIFKLNVEEYPEEFNPYDSLGEGYMIAGEKELAIKNYAKSLELNPENTNAIVMLNRINKSK